MPYLEPLFVIPWKRLLISAGTALTIVVTLLCLVWSDTRKGSGLIEFRPTTVADEIAMGTQFSRHRYLWLRLAKGEIVTFDYSIDPPGSMANIDVSELATFWHFENAALCGADPQLTFVAPRAGFYRVHFYMMRRAFGGSDPTIRLNWRTSRPSTAIAAPDVWSSANIFHLEGWEDRAAKQLRRCEES